MTFEIGLTLGILFVAVVLFVTEIIRADLVGLIVLFSLVIVGLVTPLESISGFANPAVVTIWAVFILSAGLARTGVSRILGAQVFRLAGHSESRLISVLMTSTALLSAFMNNIGVAAMFLPITLDIARRTGKSASRLLLPMAYGSLIGGMLILIGTASNLVISDFLREEGLRPLGLFEFAPIGLVILAACLIYVLFVGRHILPHYESPSRRRVHPKDDFRKQYELEERLTVITIPEGSPLSGRTLKERHFGQVLGLNMLGIERGRGIRHIPEPSFVLQEGDRLLALGRLDVINEMAGEPIEVLDEPPNASCLLSDNIRLAEIEVDDGSAFAGKTPAEISARQALGINVLAVRRDASIQRTHLGKVVLQTGDHILLQGPAERLDQLRGEKGFHYLQPRDCRRYGLDERLLQIRISSGSSLAGVRIKDTRLTRYGMAIVSITRNSQATPMPTPDTELQEGDLLVLEGRPGDIEILRGHQQLIVDPDPQIEISELETDNLAMVDVMLSPYSDFEGRTLRELDFRERYGVSLLAIWRGDRSYRTNLVDMPLEVGDALLCYGPRDKFNILAQERDFVVLNVDYQEAVQMRKAPIAALAMLGVMAAVILGWLPVYVAAIGGASLMVLTRCLSLDEAYDAIEWKAVFLIATMLPMGLAMQDTGAAALIADTVVNAVGPFGPTGVLAGIMAFTLALNQFIPSAVNAVVMTPIAIATAASLSISPYPFVMGIAYAVAASFMTPVSHPVNVLVMSPGGYRFTDYLLNGLPFCLIVLVVSVALLPFVFPF